MINRQTGETAPQLVPLWPDAARALGFRSRTAAYRAAENGVIKTVRLGKLKRVSTVWLAQKIAGEAESA